MCSRRGIEPRWGHSSVTERGGYSRELGENTLLPPGLPEEDGGWMSAAILSDFVIAEAQKA